MRRIRRGLVQRVVHDRLDHLVRHLGLRPRPGAITPTPSTPVSAKRARQRRTAFGVVPHRRAISLFPTPSAASSRPLAWSTARCGNEDDRAIASSATRSSTVSSNPGASIVNMLAP